MDKNQEITVQSSLEIQVAEESTKRKILSKYVADNMQEGTDFYTLRIGGRETKPSLSKPGSEKVLSLFHWRAEFAKDQETWEMLGTPQGVLCYVCKLYTIKDGLLVGEGRGARDIKKDGNDVNKAMKMAQKCLAGRTPVLIKTDTGILRTDLHRLSMHDSVYEGKVYIAGENGTWKRIVRFEQQKISPVKKITFQNGDTISATLDHKWPLKNGKLKETNDLKIGDTVRMSILPSGTANADSEIGWLVGLYLAEGTMGESGVRFHLHEKEIQYVERIRKFSEKIGCSVTISQKDGSHGITVNVNGHVFKGYILHYLNGENSHDKRLSKWSWSQNRNFLEELLNGYLAGDGSYTDREGRNPYWVLGFTGENRELSNDLKAISAILGYRCKIEKGIRKIGDTEYPIYTGWIKKEIAKYNGVDLGEIKEITDSDQPTYELEVDGDHLFCLANGLVTHNSAQIDAVLRTGGLSDLFTQDIEDMKDEVKEPMKPYKVERKYPEMDETNDAHDFELVVSEAKEVDKILQKHMAAGLDVPTNQKMEIARLLREKFNFTTLGKSKKQFEDKIFDLTGELLTEENFSVILEKLKGEYEIH